MDQTNRFAPPTAVVEDVATFSGDGALASRRDRFSAAFIDSVLNGIAVGVVSGVFGLGLFTTARSTLLGLVVGVTVFLALHGYLLATRGQTIGKKILKQRIVRGDGSPVAAPRLLLRYGVFYVIALVPMLMMAYSLLDLLLIFRSSRKCLHDSIADTLVVKA